MKPLIIAVVIFSASFSVKAELVDANYDANLVKGSFYCNRLGILFDLVDAIKDQDDSSVNRFFSKGDCTIVERSIKVGVIQEDRQKGWAAIVFPSGKKTGVTPLKSLKK